MTLRRFVECCLIQCPTTQLPFQQLILVHAPFLLRACITAKDDNVTSAMFEALHERRAIGGVLYEMMEGDIRQQGIEPWSRHLRVADRYPVCMLGAEHLATVFREESLGIDTLHAFCKWSPELQAFQRAALREAVKLGRSTHVRENMLN